MLENKKAEIKKDYKCYGLETAIFLTLAILTALIIPVWPFSYEIIITTSLLMGGISLLLNAHLVEEKSYKDFSLAVCWFYPDWLFSFGPSWT